jgi:pyruvate dehydrogenase complex dehydrogenase (E1) component
MTRAPEQHVVSGDRLPRQRPDVDPAEAQDWRESMDGVADHGGPHRARQLIQVERRVRAYLRWNSSGEDNDR